MHESEIRLAYEEWCKHYRKRKSEAGWELWLAAYKCGWQDKLPDYDSLSDKQKAMVEGFIHSLADPTVLPKFPKAR